MSERSVSDRLRDLTDSTRAALEALEAQPPGPQRRRTLEWVRAHFDALRHFAASHLQPLLLTQDATRALALSCRKASAQVEVLFLDLERTPPADPAFERGLRRLGAALTQLLDKTADLMERLERVLSPDHRALIAEALDLASPRLAPGY